jgi:hypothetical protein
MWNLLFIAHGLGVVKPWWILEEEGECSCNFKKKEGERVEYMWTSYKNYKKFIVNKTTI